MVTRADKDRVSRTLNDMRGKSREIAGRLKSIREQMDRESCR